MSLRHKFYCALQFILSPKYQSHSLLIAITFISTLIATSHLQATPAQNASANIPRNTGVLYVNQAVTGGNQSGSSWADAIPELGDALQAAKTANQSTPGSIQEIWVAAGTYKPTHYAGPAYKYAEYDPNDPMAEDVLVPNIESEKAFVLLPDVKIYGGFTGSESSIAQRTLPPSATILSGDLGVPGDNSDNAYHVVMVAKSTGSGLLDNFLITGGNSRWGTSSDYLLVNDYRFSHNAGGGLAIRNGGIITNCIVQNNNSSGFGGGAYVSRTTYLENVHFTQNTADRGGAMQIESFSAVITNCRFTGNTAVYGGAVNINADTIFTNCLFSGNHATGRGGALAGVGEYVLTNVTITGNRSDGAGGAIRHDQYDMNIRNSIVSGNSSGEGDDMSHDQYGTVIYRSTLVNNTWHNDSGVPVTVSGVAPANIFINPIAAASAPTPAGDYRLLENSFTIDAGDNTYFQSGQTPDLTSILTDLDKNPRISGTNIDLGAYELLPPDSNIADWTLY